MTCGELAGVWLENNAGADGSALDIHTVIACLQKAVDLGHRVVRYATGLSEDVCKTLQELGYKMRVETYSCSEGDDLKREWIIYGWAATDCINSAGTGIDFAECLKSIKE
jgi:hypothetical protein